MFQRAEFRDRAEAGRRLGQAVASLLAGASAPAHPPLVLGLPRGGVVVAAEVLRALPGSQLDIVVVRKIGAPWQPELALGAVIDVNGMPEALLDRATIDALGVDDTYLQRAIASEHAEALRRLRVYRGGEQSATSVAGRVVVVVDDGVATGATIKAALRVLRRQTPARLILAVPVAPADMLDELRSEADDVVCLHAPASFGSVGSAYERFEQTSDAEVIALLASPASA